jgi:hypothetical protein
MTTIATVTSPARRAAVESARLVAQVNLAVKAALEAGEDIPPDVCGALLVLGEWARRLEPPTPAPDGAYEAGRARSRPARPGRRPA